VSIEPSHLLNIHNLVLHRYVMLKLDHRRHYMQPRLLLSVTSLVSRLVVLCW